MKTRSIVLLVAFAVMAITPRVMMAQGAHARVSGTCRDAEGKPIAGAIVRFVSQDSGQKYELKTNAKGEYMSIAIAPTEQYKVTVLVDGKQIATADFRPGSGENPPLDFDIKAQPDQKQGTSAEQAQEMQQKIKQHDEAVAKEANTIRILQAKLSEAKTASDAGDYAAAIKVLTDATQVDGTRDLIWYNLAEAYSNFASQPGDPAEKKKRLETAVANYEKALDLKNQQVKDAAAKGPNPAWQAEAANFLGGYYNGLANAYARLGKSDAAAQAYTNAAQQDPANRGMYYFNLGAMLTNASKGADAKLCRDAADAFDKVIAADPSRADAYYWKAENLRNAGTPGAAVPQGTVEAYQKYLQLSPDGSHAAEVKDLLSKIGASPSGTQK